MKRNDRINKFLFYFEANEHARPPEVMDSCEPSWRSHLEAAEQALPPARSETLESPLEDEHPSSGTSTIVLPTTREHGSSRACTSAPRRPPTMALTDEQRRRGGLRAKLHIDALRLVRRELSYQARLHDEEIGNLRGLLSTVTDDLDKTSAELRAVAAERDRLLETVKAMRSSGWQADGSGGWRPPKGGATDDQKLTLDRLVREHHEAAPQVSSSAGCTSSYPWSVSPARLTEAQREQLTARLVAAGEDIEHKKRAMAEQSLNRAESSRVIGVKPLSAEHIRSASQRMHGAAEEHRQRHHDLLQDYAEQVRKGSYEIGGFGSVIQFGLPNTVPSWGRGPRHSQMETEARRQRSDAARAAKDSAAQIVAPFPPPPKKSPRAPSGASSAPSSTTCTCSATPSRPPSSPRANHRKAPRLAVSLMQHKLHTRMTESSSQNRWL
jgi:hypothetical protein